MSLLLQRRVAADAPAKTGAFGCSAAQTFGAVRSIIAESDVAMTRTNISIHIDMKYANTVVTTGKQTGRTQRPVCVSDSQMAARCEPVCETCAVTSPQPEEARRIGVAGILHGRLVGVGGTAGDGKAQAACKVHEAEAIAVGRSIEPAARRIGVTAVLD